MVDLLEIESHLSPEYLNRPEKKNSIPGPMVPSRGNRREPEEGLTIEGGTYHLHPIRERSEGVDFGATYQAFPILNP